MQVSFATLMATFDGSCALELFKVSRVDTDHAALYGDAEAAILYKHVRYWCEYNKRHKKQYNYHKERYWMYDSLDAFHKS